MAKERVKLRGDWDAQSHAYLFKQPGAGNFGDICVISCHGTYKNSTGDYAPPAGITLHFFVNHGQTLDDLNNCREVLSGALRPTNAVTYPATCTNYNLTKLQDGTSAIKELAEESGRSYSVAEDLLGVMGETYKGLMDLNQPRFDIATARARKVNSGISLSKMISAIERVHSYGTYYCAFCRELKG